MLLPLLPGRPERSGGRPGSGARWEHAQRLRRRRAVAQGTDNALLIHGTLTGALFGTAQGEAMWYRAPTGAVSLLLLEGDTLEVSPGVFKTIAELDSALGGGHAVGDASRSVFTDTGYFIFRAEFADGTYGVYRGQVPSPGALVLPALALAVATRRRRA